MKIIQLDTNIILYQIQLSDAEDIFYAIDSQRNYLGTWLPFVEFTKSIDDTKAFINSVINPLSGNEEFVFVIHYNQQFAGLAGFNHTDMVNRRAAIGYWLCQQFQGKGIMTKVVTALCNFAFTELHINRIQINCAINNSPSNKIPRKLGFTFEGIERDGELLSNGQFTDIAVYSKLFKDWCKEQ